MNDKVTCLKGLLSKLTNVPVADIEGDDICDLLHQITKAVSNPATQVVGARANFARKTVGGEKVILGYEGNIYLSLILANGSVVPATIEFTDIE